MEDAQVPDADMLKEYFPNDNSGTLIKNHSWFEGDVAPLSDAYLNFINESWCVLGNFTTTLNGVPNQLKPERYRWMWWLRQWIGSANNFSDVFGLIRAANLPVNNPAYYAQMEALVDTEEWMRFSAIEHASGDWDSFFTQNQWNMYNYKPTHGKWTAMKWDWNISLGGGTTTWGPDGSQLFNAGSYDSVMAAFQSYPAYRRAYLRALQDIANLAMNNAKVNPLLNAKYAAFQENGLTTTSYGIVVNSPNRARRLDRHDAQLAAGGGGRPRRQRRQLCGELGSGHWQRSHNLRHRAAGGQDGRIQWCFLARDVAECHRLDREGAARAGHQRVERGGCRLAWPTGLGRDGLDDGDLYRTAHFAGGTSGHQRDHGSARHPGRSVCGTL